MSNEFNLFFLLSFRFRLFRLFVKQYFIILYTYKYSSFSWLCLMLVVISIIISVENFRFWHVRVYILLYCTADVFFFNGAAAAFLWIFIMIVIVVYVSAHSECDVSLLTSLCVDVDKRLSFFRFFFQHVYKYIQMAWQEEFIYGQKHRKNEKILTIRKKSEKS